MKQTRLMPILLLLVAQLVLFTHTATAAERPTRRIGLPPPLATATKLYAQQQGDGIMLRWEVVAGCDGYRVYHEAGDALLPGSAWFDVNGPTTSSHQFTDVVASGHYSFRVSAMHGGEEGPASPLVTVIMKGKKTSVRSDAGK